jgi:2'-5' RNA ligase
MAYAVVLTLDPRSEEAIRRLWDGLADAKLTVALRDGGATPHITLAVFGTQSPLPPFPAAGKGDGEERAGGLGAGLGEIPQLELYLSHVGVFPGDEGVVFAGATPTSELLALHKAVHEVMGPQMGEPRAYYLPGRWVPHVTLAIRLNALERMAAVRWLHHPPPGYPAWPIRAWGVALTLLEIPGDKKRQRVPLLAPPEKPV